MRVWVPQIPEQGEPTGGPEARLAHQALKQMGIPRPNLTHAREVELLAAHLQRRPVDWQRGGYCVELDEDWVRKQLEPVREQRQQQPVVVPPVVVPPVVQRTVYYCQNPNQSGDTNGVGYALVLHPDRRLLFFLNQDEVRVALSFIRFYADLGISRDRIIAIVCDADSTRRPKLPTAGKRTQLAESMTVWAQHNPLGEEAPTGKKALNQFTQRSEVMEKHLGPLLLAEFGRRSRTFLASPEHVASGTAEHRELHALATVKPWTGDTLSGNQLYQSVSDPERKSWVKLKIAELLGIKPQDQLCNVGQTTQDVMALTRQRGTATIGAMRNVFRGPIQAIDQFTDTFLNRLLPGPGRPILVLIWIRGVSGTERRKLAEAQLGGGDITEGNFGRVNSAKRNPHHVMTAQLYDAIVRMVERLSHASQRPYLACPIGDEIYLNQYAPSPDTRHLASSDTNLVNFFSRLPEFGYSLGRLRMGARRFHQSYFLHRLATHRRLSGVVQIGLRSGAMETLMYLGFPTLYIEDLFEESGPRMAAVTSEGALQAATDLAFLQEHKKVQGDRAALARLRQQRDASQIALLPSPLNTLFAERQQTDGILQAAAPGISAVHQQSPERTPPFPFFFRLLTRNLIGMNPIGTGTVERLAFRFGGSVRQARGALTEHEMELLMSLTAYSGEAMSEYQAAITAGRALERPEDYLFRAFKGRRFQ